MLKKGQNSVYVVVECPQTLFPASMVYVNFRYSADHQKAISDLRLIPYPLAILKVHPPSSLDYWAFQSPTHLSSTFSCQKYNLSNYSNNARQ